MSASPLAPGSTIGILGGGQLGRMLAMAAARLGYRTVIFDPDPNAPAAQVANAHFGNAWDDGDALAAFAEACDVVTYEFENVPVETVERLERSEPVRPGAKALRTAQDRLLEKALARNLGAATAEFAAVDSLSDLKSAMKATGLPAVLKTTRLGYDGKGQARIAVETDAEEAFAAMKGAPAILESFVHFDREVSIIAARGLDGTVRTFDLVENVHRHHILHTSTVPARIEREAAESAATIAGAFLEALDYVGVLAVEFFAVREEGSHKLLVNEIAPRVHNSGHWTEAACTVSQFEAHIRAIAGLALPDFHRHSDCVMENLIGDEINELPRLAGESGVLVHHYGKAEARTGRKMGHFTRLMAPAGVDSTGL
ncbi:MAG: 5-(carboxyamino)imidazole ribonucleotide synthase [Rhizobiales bacterium]|nr:5-(carboxyamino)imidazole ribonucleotide synthase [Hyphomicrobiales bacterium]